MFFNKSTSYYHHLELVIRQQYTNFNVLIKYIEK